MAITKTLAFNTVPQNIVAQTVCWNILVKEAEDVVGWPTTNLIIKKPSTGDVNVITAGKSYSFACPPGKPWRPSDVVGQVYLPVGSTTGIQDEQ